MNAILCDLNFLVKLKMCANKRNDDFQSVQSVSDLYISLYAFVFVFVDNNMLLNDVMRGVHTFSEIIVQFVCNNNCARNGHQMLFAGWFP